MANTKDFNGKWALVTGASAGIGVALARELATHGAKLILTARRKDRLDSLAAELTAKGTEVRILVADLNDPAAPQQIYDATEGAGINVDILINNAGLGQFGAFYESPVEQEISQVRVNCEAMVRLSRLFVPRMVDGAAAGCWWWLRQRASSLYPTSLPMQPPRPSIASLPWAWLPKSPASASR